MRNAKIGLSKRQGGQSPGHQSEPLQRARPHIPCPVDQRVPTPPATTEEQEEILKHTGLAVFIGRKIVGRATYCENQELVAISVDTILRCIRGYDKNRGEAAFGTYLGQALARNFQRHRTRMQFMRRTQGDSKPSSINPNPILMADRGVVEEIEEPEREVCPELLAKVAEAFGQLKPRWQEVLHLYLGLDGLPRVMDETLAKRFGVSRARIYQIISEGLRRICEIAGLPTHNLAYTPVHKNRCGRMGRKRTGKSSRLLAVHIG